MSGQATPQVDNVESNMEIDPWEQAFAAVAGEANGDLSSATTGAGSDEMGTADQTPAVDNGHQDATDANTGVSGGTEANTDQSDGVGGPGDGGSLGDQESDQGSTEVVDVEAYENEIKSNVESQAISEMAQAYIQKGFRHTGDKLGADINQSDICKRDSEGRPHYYNPDTGREFTGDDPGAQAQAWCDRYNKQLADAFNNSCQKYIDHLMEEQQPMIDMLKFEPTYDNLDPIRQSMLDNLLEDYEIVKNGEVVGYSCDLNKALAAVNRQVKTIQEKYRMSKPAETEAAPAKPEPKGPALDMKKAASDASKPGKKPEFKSIAEAMEWEQNQLLAQLKEKDASRGH